MLSLASSRVTFLFSVLVFIKDQLQNLSCMVISTIKILKQ